VSIWYIERNIYSMYSLTINRFVNLLISNAPERIPERCPPSHQLPHTSISCSLPHPWTLFSLHHSLRVDLSLQLNPGVEPAVYTLYPFQTFFSQKAKYLATNQKCTPAKTGWVRGTQQAQSESNPVLLPYHSIHCSFAGSHFATALAIGRTLFTL
jgi:hypothetical protein